jgi:hypothetical protein
MRGTDLVRQPGRLAPPRQHRVHPVELGFVDGVELACGAVGVDAVDAAGQQHVELAREPVPDNVAPAFDGEQERSPHSGDLIRGQWLHRCSLRTGRVQVIDFRGS